MHTISLKKKWSITEKKQSLIADLEVGKGNYIQHNSRKNTPVLILRPDRTLDYNPGTVLLVDRDEESFIETDPAEALTGLWVAYQDWSFQDMYIKSLMMKKAYNIFIMQLFNFPLELSGPKILELEEQLPSILENASRNFLLLRKTFRREDFMKFECLFKAHLRSILALSYSEFTRRLMLNSYLLSYCCLAGNLKYNPTNLQFDLFVGTDRIRLAWESEFRENDEFRRVFGRRNYRGLPPSEYLEYVFYKERSDDDCQG